MGIKLTKIFNSTKTKLFWLYLIFGFLFMVAGVTLCSPLWQDALKVEWFFAGWGREIVKLVISAILILYIIFFLGKRIRGNGVVKTLTIVEMILLSLIALGGVLSQFNVIKIGDASQILGCALWLRGTVEIFHAYYYHANEGEKKYPVWMVALSIALITVGTWLFVTNKITNDLILWIMVAIIFIAGLFLFVWGFIKKPARIKKEKVKKEKKVKEKKAKPVKEKKAKPVKEKKVKTKKQKSKNKDVVEEIDETVAE